MPYLHVPNHATKRVSHLSLLLTLLALPPMVAAQSNEPEGDDTIEEQLITGNAQINEIEQTGFNVDVIDTEEFKNLNRDINQILNTTAGILVRQNGGLGSDFSLSLNGLSGDQVRYFVDGVPMENFGTALAFNNYPANLIRDIEVFKGVVPIELGSDALAGAINLITPSLDQNFTDLSYSFGSFNTHRLALMYQYSDPDGVFVRLSSFLNHSDNDYTMRDIPARDALGNLVGTQDVKRFNDAYSSAMISIKTGVIEQDYADELSVQLTYAANRNEFQHPEKSINLVFGQLNASNQTWLLSGRYTKDFDPFYVDFYVIGGTVNETFDDTVSRRYDWLGNYVETDPSRGEFGPKSRLHLDDSVLRSNLVMQYPISDAHVITGNVSANLLGRSGDDDFRADNVTPFADPNQVDKYVLGLNYQFSTPEDRSVTDVFVKQYFYNAKIDRTVEELSGPVDVVNNVSLSETGYGLTTRYVLMDDWSVKASYEKAYRMPEADEILGNGRYILPNTDLTPEDSNNFNVGMDWKTALQNSQYGVHLNFFYRDANNFIKAERYREIYIKNFNIGAVEIQGVETTFTAGFMDIFNINLNLTYQDLTDRTKTDSEGDPNLNIGNRLPNIPYFFANLRAGFDWPIDTSQLFSVYLQSHYVHEYFLYWEGLGDQDQKNKIDTQFTNDLEFIYEFAHGTYNLALSIENISDEVVYDNFNIQKQGRAAYLKFRYFID